MVRYRTPGGRLGKSRLRSFGHNKVEADDFALKVEYDKRAKTFIDPIEGEVPFRVYAATWLDQRIIADSSSGTYASVLRTHIYPAFGDKKINTIRRQDIKALVAAMRKRGISPSRINTAHLVVNAIFNEAVRDKKLSESPCREIELPDVCSTKDLIPVSIHQIELLAANLPRAWAATIWLMHGCGLRIGEALAVNVNCRIADGRTLRVREQINPTAERRPLKFRRVGEFRDVPLPQYVSDAIDDHITYNGTTDDGYLFRGHEKKFVTRNTYRENFKRALAAAHLPDKLVPHSLRHRFASVALAKGIPITDVSRWLGHKNIETTYRIYGHLIPGSWERARQALDEARNGSSIDEI